MPHGRGCCLGGGAVCQPRRVCPQAATHCFDKSLLATVIEDNINPIDKVERTSLVMTS